MYAYAEDFRPAPHGAGYDYHLGPDTDSAYSNSPVRPLKN